MTDTTLSGRVAANIRAELARRNTTQEQLATAINMARSSLHHRLSGRTAMTLEEVERIAGALELDPDRLLTTRD